MCKRGILSLAAAAALLVVVGCEDDDDLYDHRPPEGSGALIVNNNTTDDFDLFVDGAFVTEVKDGRERILDYEPGIYRVVLDPDDGFGSFREDVDVLEGRLTILHVEEDFSLSRNYRVFVEID